MPKNFGDGYTEMRSMPAARTGAPTLGPMQPAWGEAAVRWWSCISGTLQYSCWEAQSPRGVGASLTFSAVDAGGTRVPD